MVNWIPDKIGNYGLVVSSKHLGENSIDDIFYLIENEEHGSLEEILLSYDDRVYGISLRLNRRGSDRGLYIERYSLIYDEGFLFSAQTFEKKKLVIDSVEEAINELLDWVYYLSDNVRGHVTVFN